MSTQKKPAKGNEDIQAALQGLIAQGKKDGMIRAAELNSLLEKTQLTAEKIEEIYDRFEAMNIQIVTAELELDLGDDELGLDAGDGIIPQHLQPKLQPSNKAATARQDPSEAQGAPPSQDARSSSVFPFPLFQGSIRDPHH